MLLAEVALLWGNVSKGSRKPIGDSPGTDPCSRCISPLECFDPVNHRRASRSAIPTADHHPLRVVVLDTQVYSNTGGQACTSGYTGQVSDMAEYGRAQHGKVEVRKELFQRRFRSGQDEVEERGRFSKLRREVAKLETILRERELGVRGQKPVSGGQEK